MPKFTDMYLKSLKPRDKKYQVREATGFALRVASTGSKAFLFIYESEGKRKEVNLGKYPSVGIAEAREKYNELRRLWDRGESPTTKIEVVQEEPEQDVLISVNALAEIYIEWSKSEKQDVNHVRTKQRALEMHVLPLIGTFNISELKRKDVVRAFGAILKAGVPSGAARNAFKATNAMFEYAVLQGHLDTSPCYAIWKAIPSIRSVEKIRALNTHEVPLVWSAIEHADALPETKNALKMVLVTAQRPGEVVSMHWDEVDGDFWTIPPWKAKKGKRYHRVYLTTLTKQLMGDRKEGYVFPSPHVTSDKHLSITTLQHLARNIKVCSGWTPHDLRRTARTHMSRLRIPREHAEAVLNHAKQGMVKVYDQYDFDDEKKEALQAWTTELRLLIQSTNSE